MWIGSLVKSGVLQVVAHSYNDGDHHHQHTPPQIQRTIWPAALESGPRCPYSKDIEVDKTPRLNISIAV